jgi:4-hydroxybenzoate polyprenyltransferase
MRALRSIAVFAEAIKLSHTVFALPFALAAAFLAAGAVPAPLLLLKIALACAFARTAAMAFNRWADSDFDRENPRTARRAVPAGELSPGFMLAAAAAAASAFVASAAWINALAFALSPVALAVLLGYSYMKRITSLSHAVLGLALGLAPLGAWIAVRGEFAVVPILLGLAVLAWTAGFDIIYACQDFDFDRRAGLLSIPSRWGIARALSISRALHAAAVALLAGVGAAAGLGALYAAGVAVVALLLFLEHRMVSPHDLSRVSVAFFTLNGLVSVFFLVAVLADVVS